jgi:D-alanyl-D-alanine carboxypeptidase (penicillin-binding protein 5/6)
VAPPCRAESVTYPVGVHSPLRRRLPLIAATLVVAAVLGTTPLAVAAPSPSPATTPGPVDHATVVGKGPGVGRFPPIITGTFVLADATTGRILAERLPHQRRPPASTLKALTALTLLPRLDLQSRVTAVASDVQVSGSRVGLVPGSSYTIDQVFTGLFLPSGNDAAKALARANVGTPTTVREMNETARWLGAVNTVAKNPSGLDARGQVSTAYDLALIGREGLKEPQFAHYARIIRTSFPGREPRRPGAKRSSFQIQTQNRLLRDGYPGMIGVKTGYTTLAGRTYIGAAQRGSTRLIVTIMGNAQMTEPIAKSLLNWGFANDAKVITPVGQLVEPKGPAPWTVASGAGDSQHNEALPVSASRTSASSVSSRMVLRWTVMAVALACAAGLVAFAYVGNGSLSRRRIRRRYNR